MTDLLDGESTEMQGSGKKPYIIKNTGGVYSCSCPAWRNQSNSIDLRTCKHIIKLRGEAAEKERLGEALPEKAKKVSKSKATVAKQEAAKARKPDLLLAHSWDGVMNPVGWWMSEKLDGVRAYWDGENFISRLGNVYHAPDWFKECLPKIPLDGELFVGRGQFQRTVSIVRRQDKSDDWKEVKYMVFDTLDIDEDFEYRMHYLTQLFAVKPDHVELLTQTKCASVAHFEVFLQMILDMGGEGVMLRQPGSKYEGGRSTTLLKVKKFHDAEATIVGYNAGKGHNKGRLGSYQCKTDGGIEFDLSGMSNKERENPLPIGTVVTYRYQELTNAGKPRFPTFLRVREDV